MPWKLAVLVCCAVSTVRGFAIGAAPSPRAVAATRAVPPTCLFNFGGDKEATATKGKKAAKRAVKKTRSLTSVKLEGGKLKTGALPGLVALGAGPGGAAVILGAILLSGAGKAPDSLPFDFLNGFYPASPQNQKARATKTAEEAKAKAAAEAKAKAEKEAKAKADAKAAAAKKAPAGAKAPAAAAAPAAAPAPEKTAEEKAAEEAKAKEKAKAEKDKAAAAEKAKKEKEAAEKKKLEDEKKAIADQLYSAKYTAKGLAGTKEYKAKVYMDSVVAIQERNRGADPKTGKLGPATKPLPVINKELAGQPGFNAQGQPSYPGAVEQYKREQARAAAAAEVKAAREKAYKEAKAQADADAQARAERKAARLAAAGKA